MIRLWILIEVGAYGGLKIVGFTAKAGVRFVSFSLLSGSFGTDNFY